MDKDIKSKHDLRTKAGKAAANAEQHERDEWGNFWFSLVFSAVAIIYFAFIIIPILAPEVRTDDELLFLDWIAYSDFKWWGWPLFGLSVFFGIAVIWQLFTDYWDRLLVVLICFGVVAAGLYFIFA